MEQPNILTKHSTGINPHKALTFPVFSMEGSVASRRLSPPFNATGSFHRRHRLPSVLNSAVVLTFRSPERWLHKRGHVCVHCSTTRVSRGHDMSVRRLNTIAAKCSVNTEFPGLFHFCLSPLVAESMVDPLIYGIYGSLPSNNNPSF